MLTEEKCRLLLLSIILIVISMIATSAAVALLYRVALEERRQDLVVTAQSQARMIEAFAQYSQQVYDHGADYDPLEGTLQQVIAAHEAFEGFGETGEFTLAQKIDDQIEFRFRHHAYSVSKPEPVPFTSDLAEPMRRALSGKSGSMIGLDYRAATVLAAYEPVAHLNLGIVAKVDLAAVRQPFIVAGAIAFGLTFILIMAGVLLLRRTIAPLFSRLHRTSEGLSAEMEQHKQALNALRESEMQFQQIADVAEDVFWLIDCENPDEPKFLYVSQAFENIWQRSVAEVLHDPQLWLASIHPDDKNRLLDDFYNFLRGKGPCNHEFKITMGNGETRNLWIKGGLVRDVAGNIIRAAGLVHDISSIKAAESIVQHANLELETRVAERTAELNRTIKLMTGREIRMAELKKEIARLQQELQAAKENG